MKKKVGLWLVTVVAIACIVYGLTGCASQTGTTASSTLKQGMSIAKGVAESILFNARVLQNAGKITETQFNQVRAAYDTLEAGERGLLTSLTTFAQNPTPANQNLYQLDVMKLIRDMQTLTSVAMTLGIKVEPPKEVK